MKIGDHLNRQSAKDIWQVRHWDRHLDFGSPRGPHPGARGQPQHADADQQRVTTEIQSDSRPGFGSPAIKRNEKTLPGATDFLRLLGIPARFALGRLNVSTYRPELRVAVRHQVLRVNSSKLSKNI